jgi:hypothetical protein
MGFSQHSGMVIVADGTDAAARRLERVLWNDPASGVWRHADAGYDIALDCAREHGFDWRISTAKISQSGPFSSFPGIGRVLTVIEGGAMRLHFDDGRIIDAHPGSGPHVFSGEDACVAELLGEPLIDLNLMVRAPLEGAVHQGGEKVHAEGLVACWLFALKPLPALFLATYDLLELLATVDHVVPRDALVLSVRRPG